MFLCLYMKLYPHNMVPAITQGTMKLLSYYQVITRQVMYVLRNIVAGTCKHFCSGKAVLHNLCVHFVTNGTQRAMRTSRNSICGLPHSAIVSVTCPTLQ